MPLAGGEPRKLTEPQGGRDPAGVVAGRRDHRVRRARARRRLRRGGRQAPRSRGASRACSTSSTTSAGRSTAGSTCSRSRPTAPASPSSSPTATSRTPAPRGRRTAPRSPSSRRGTPTGTSSLVTRRVPGGRRGRRAAAAHPGRRLHRRPLLVARRRPARRAAVPGRVRRPEAHADRAWSTPAAARSGCSPPSLDRNCGTYPQMREPVWDGDDIVFAVEDHGNTHLYRVRRRRLGRARARRRRRACGDRASTSRAGGSCTPPTSPRGSASCSPAARRRPPPHGRRRRLRRRPRARRRRALHGRLGRRHRGRGVGHEAGRLRARPEVPHAAQHPRRAVRPVRQHASSTSSRCTAAPATSSCSRNPRGSSGYSEAWGRAIRGPGEAGPGWGSVDYEDCMAVIEEAVRRFDFIDGERLGVIGRLLRRLHDVVDREPHRQVQGGRLRARREPAGLGVGLQRLRLGLQGLHRRVRLRGRGRVPQHLAGDLRRATSTRRS